jgi:hypothetical protein
VAAEQAALNALGLGARIEAIQEKLLDDTLSNFERFSLDEDLIKFQRHKKAFDDEQKA